MIETPLHMSSRYRQNATAPATPLFATTSAEFHLKHELDDTSSICYAQPLESAVAVSEDSAVQDDLTSLSHLRSNAFWELHRSIRENGEGLVQRMRDYEYSRSRSDIYSMPMEAQRRGRRSSDAISPWKMEDLQSATGDDDEDDIQFFSGDDQRMLVCGNSGRKRSLSLGSVNESSNQLDFPRTQSERSSSPAETSSSSMYHSSDDSEVHGQPATDANRPCLPSGLAPLTPLLSHTLSDSTNSSIVSLPLPSSLPPSSYPLARSATSSRSEKAIAALALAMANGAGGLTDYETLLAIQSTPAVEACQVGEMWD